MTKRWILGFLNLGLVCPSFNGNGRLITKLRTSSSFDKLNNFLIFDALFGPNLRGIVLSVNPGISLIKIHKIIVLKGNITLEIINKIMSLTILRTPSHGLENVVRVSSFQFNSFKDLFNYL